MKDKRTYPYKPQDMRDTLNPCVRSLNHFLRSLNNPHHLSLNDWNNFYDYIIISYNQPQERRHKISELSDILRARGINKPGSLAVLYAHILYAFARRDGKALYRGGFNP